MNRRITNIIRFFLDEFLPPVIRDKKWFMYLFYVMAYRTFNVKKIMNFKSVVYQFTEDEYFNFYQNLNSISRNRKTDLNEASIKKILESIDSECKNLIDVGCGKGFLLNQIKLKYPAIDLFGIDCIKHSTNEYKYVYGNIETTPFQDKEFDIVTCCHTLEHIINLPQVISELKRIAKKKLIIVVPKQRYYYYTLDEHIHFFYNKDILINYLGFKDYEIENINGDWFFIGYLQ